MKIFSIGFAGFLLTLLINYSVSAFASPQIENAAEKGTKVAQEIARSDDGFIGEKSKMDMTLLDAHGSKIVRELESKGLEVQDDGDKTINIFLKPQDVKGTKLLTWTHGQSSDDQWLYLPSLKRVKRITSNNRSASFLGSEFSYEDLGGQDPDKFNYVFLRDDLTTVGGKKLWVLQRIAKEDNSSGYSKEILWVDQTTHIPEKVEYYDRKGEILKIAEFSNITPYVVAGKNLFRANKIHMKNLQTKKESIIEWKKRELGIKFHENEFAKDALN